MSLHIGEQEATELDDDQGQEEAATTQPKYADGYVYEPLPGDRWIRILVLEPARELDCPLIARLELLALGPGLPIEPKPQNPPKITDDEKQRNEAYVSLVNARRLPYTALSYSWAMNDGDDSPCRVLILHGKQVAITRNLSESLRRIRLKTGPQRLWVDALCIDQQNTMERSAQVAMMADIFKFATRCIVWLGEDPTKESDLAVWQLSHCISPDLDTEAMGVFPDNHSEITVIVLNAMMAVDKSRCTIHGCNGHHPRLESADFADTSLIRFVRWRDAKYQQPLHYRLWLKLMLRSRPNTIRRKLSLLKEWLDRRYWRRRWIVQENASRSHSYGAADYYWGRFYLSRKRLRAMLRVLSVVELSFPDLLGCNPDRTSIEGPLAVLQAGTEEGKDLCDHLATHSRLDCSDARDRLYSLVALDPGYGVQVDYAMPLREVCIEFSKLMVRRGDCSRLLRALIRNESPEGVATSLDLPSWAIDLRAATVLLSKQGYAQTWNAVVDANLQLSLELYPIGFLADMEQDPCNTKKRYLIMEPHGVRLYPAKVTSRKRSNSARPTFFLRSHGESSCKKGDILYAYYYGSRLYLFLWLRPVNNEPPLQHRIIDVFHFYQLQSSIEGDVRDLDPADYELPEDSWKTVHIV